MTLLDLVKEFSRRVGTPVPGAVASSTDPGLVQIVALMNEEVEETSRVHTLQEFIKERTFVTVAAEDQGTLTTVAGEVVRYILNDTLWNRSTRLPVFGPENPQQWQLRKAFGFSGTLLTYRIRSNRLLFAPVPAAGETIAFEYVPVNIVIDGDTSTSKQSFTKDTDTTLIPDDVMMAGIRWRWRREKGFPYAEDLARYDRLLGSHKLREGTRRMLSMSEDIGMVGPGIVVPPGSWNIP